VNAHVFFMTDVLYLGSEHWCLTDKTEIRPKKP